MAAWMDVSSQLAMFPWSRWTRTQLHDAIKNNTKTYVDMLTSSEV